MTKSMKKKNQISIETKQSIWLSKEAQRRTLEKWNQTALTGMGTLATLKLRRVPFPSGGSASVTDDWHGIRILLNPHGPTEVQTRCSYYFPAHLLISLTFKYNLFILFYASLYNLFTIYYNSWFYTVCTFTYLSDQLRWISSVSTSALLPLLVSGFSPLAVMSASPLPVTFFSPLPMLT